MRVTTGQADVPHPVRHACLRRDCPYSQIRKRINRIPYWDLRITLNGPKRFSNLSIVILTLSVVEGEESHTRINHKVMRARRPVCLPKQ